MCGIAGHIVFKGRADDSGVARMTQAIQARGPDDSGLLASPTKQVVFGHRRLSILDLSGTAHQPMLSQDGNTMLVFNGEIYNFRELRERFFSENESFRSSGDTEVLLRLWQKCGPDCVRHLRGMFAFAVWEERSETLTLVRDPCGIKPLYFGETKVGLGKGRFFASDLRAIRAFDAKWNLDKRALGLFLKWGSIPAPATPLEGVLALEAGTIVQFSDSGTKSWKYWDYSEVLRRGTEKPLNFASRDDVVAYVREELKASVRAHLVSDVPVGAFLSGGIDSSAVVALMRELGQKDIGTFCIGFESEEFDESKHAGAVARLFETNHTCWTLTKADFIRAQEQFFDAMDMPSADGLNTFLVSNLAHRNGYKVVTSGIGGDEIFAGYARDFNRIPKLWRRMQLGGWPAQAALRVLVKGGVGLNVLSQQWQRVADYLIGQPSLVRCLNMGRGLFTEPEIREMFADKQLGVAIACTSEDSYLPELSPELHIRDAVSLFLLSRYLSSQLLKDSDTFSMAYSLELRTPLVDSVLYESLAKISDKSLFYGGDCPKSLLVDAVGNLPRDITHRVKKGFTPPFELWLQGQDYELESNFLDCGYFSKAFHAFRSGKMHWSRIWALIVLDRYLARVFS